MNRLISALPVWWVLADMLYGFALNVWQSLAAGQAAKPPADGLPVSPEIAFSSLQLVANGGMILVVGFGLLILLRLNRTVLQQEAMYIGGAETFGLLAVLAFSLRSVGEWLWAFWQSASGIQVISTDNWRYLATAACMPWIALLCLWRLWRWQQLNRLRRPTTPEPMMFPPDAADL